MGLPKKHVCPEHENAERYLLTYADMITLLLALFIVLYAMSIQDPIKYEIIASSLSKAFNTGGVRGNVNKQQIMLGPVTNAFAGMTSVGETVGEELTSYALKEELGDQISVTSSKDAVVITLAGGMVFSSGSSSSALKVGRPWNSYPTASWRSRTATRSVLRVIRTTFHQILSGFQQTGSSRRRARQLRRTCLQKSV